MVDDGMHVCLQPGGTHAELYGAQLGQARSRTSSDSKNERVRHAVAEFVYTAKSTL